MILLKSFSASISKYCYCNDGVALLQQCRAALMRCYDPAQVFQCINK